MVAGAEEGRIGRALGSVADWTSEIVVVINAEVTDGTEAIARAHGAKIFREPWKGHIAQKTSAAAKTSCEWILGLDADEEVSPELREQFRRLFAQPKRLQAHAAYSFPRRSWYCGRWIRHGDWYPDRQLRLWRRGQGHWAGTDPHDKLHVSGSVGRLRGDLYHHSFDSLNHHLRKVISFSDEYVRQHENSGKRPGCFELVARPAWRFFRAYFLRLGFLDGWAGYYIAQLTAFSTFTRYAKLREAKAAADRVKTPHPRQG